MGSAWRGLCPKCGRWIRVTWNKRDGSCWLVKHGPRDDRCGGSNWRPSRTEPFPR